MGALDSDDRVTVDNHLRVCAECRREAAEFSQTRSLLADRRSAEVPKSLSTWPDLAPSLATPQKRRPAIGGVLGYGAVGLAAAMIAWAMLFTRGLVAPANRPDSPVNVVTKQSSPLRNPDTPSATTHVVRDEMPVAVKRNPRKFQRITGTTPTAPQKVVRRIPDRQPLAKQHDTIEVASLDAAKPAPLVVAAYVSPDALPVTGTQTDYVAIDSVSAESTELEAKGW